MCNKCLDKLSKKDKDIVIGMTKQFGGDFGQRFAKNLIQMEKNKCLVMSMPIATAILLGILLLFELSYIGVL